MPFKFPFFDVETGQSYEHWSLEHYDRWITTNEILCYYAIYKDQATKDRNEGFVRKVVVLSGSDVTATSSESGIDTKVRAGTHKISGADVDFTGAVNA